MNGILPQLSGVQKCFIKHLCVFMQSNFKVIAVGLPHDKRQRGQDTLCPVCENWNTMTSLVQQPLLTLRWTLFSVMLGLCTWVQVPEQARRRHWIFWSGGGWDCEPLTRKCRAISLAPWTQLLCSLWIKSNIAVLTSSSIQDYFKVLFLFQFPHGCVILFTKHSILNQL